MNEFHPDNVRMTLGEHLEELRRRLLWALAGLAVGVVAALFFGREILEALEFPYIRVMTQLGRTPRLRVLAAGEGFAMYLRVTLLAGVLLAAPWIVYQFWRFVSVGLHRHERRAVLWAVPLSAGLFLAGAMFYLFVVAVPILFFFLRFNDYLGVDSDLTLPNHIAMMVNMMLVFGIAFQLPVVLAVLGWMGILSARQLGRYRRHVIVGLLIFAALMTSPSPVDQVLLALPMWLLFELGVLLVWGVRRRRRDRYDTPFDESS